MSNKNQENEQHWKLLVLLLKEIASEQKVSNYKIAELTGYSESTIGRVFKLEFCPKLQIFLDIMRVLELNLFFETRDSNNTDNTEWFEKAMISWGRRSDKLPKN